MQIEGESKILKMTVDIIKWTMVIILLGSFALSLIVAVILLWPDRPPPPDLHFLATNLYYKVAGYEFEVPEAALDAPQKVFTLKGDRRDEKVDLKSLAGDPSHPLQSVGMGLSMKGLFWGVDEIYFAKSCPLLSRHWTRSLCEAAGRRGAFARLPESFTLIEPAEIDYFKRLGTVGGETVYDQIKTLISNADEARIGCDKKDEYCSAVQEVKPGLLAVWIVWPDKKTGQSALDVARIQGKALVAFVDRAIGKVEKPLADTGD
jgi:hypothetical protein